MKSFLEYVAEDVIRKYGTNLSHIAIVFPNKRASLFLNEALARQAQRPIWSPAYITISNLFRQQSDLQVADPIQSVCLLHQSFCAMTGSPTAGNCSTNAAFCSWRMARWWSDVQTA